MYEWSEEKRSAALKKHGIDFVDAVEVFANDHLLVEARSEVEQRKCAIGMVNGRLATVIFTRRDDAIRIITARRARKNEREAYHARFPQGGETAAQ